MMDILNGHIKELFGLEKELSEKRFKICRKCPIFSPRFGGICNSHLWVDLKTGDISTTKRDNYINGCGCRLEAKTRLQDAKCPCKKW